MKKLGGRFSNLQLTIPGQRDKELPELTAETSRKEGASLLNSNILTLSEDVNDATFKNQVNNRASKTEFKDEIVNAFVANHGAKKNSIPIKKFKG